jgi:serine beta-lactamase-like protein LACTB, mitochondrial
MKFCSIFLLQHHLVVVLVLILTGSGWSQTTENAAAAAAQALLDQAVANHQFAGVAAGFATADTIRWTGAAGYRDVAAASPFLPTTITRMASIAKTLTAVAVLQLYERGLIDLDAPIQTYLPEFPRKPQGEITTRQLLQHSSGIGGYTSGKEAESQVAYPTLAAAVALFQDRDLVSVPGQEYQYSTYGYVVLGLLIERVSGQSYEAYLQEHIWHIAGMPHTGVVRFGQPQPGQTELYSRSKKGKIKAAQENNS